MVYHCPLITGFNLKISTPKNSAHLNQNFPIIQEFILIMLIITTPANYCSPQNKQIILVTVPR